MRITITHVRLEYRKLLNVEASGLRFSALCLRKAEAVKISVARGAGGGGEPGRERVLELCCGGGRQEMHVGGMA